MDARPPKSFLPIIASNSVKYELADRTQAISHGRLIALLNLATDVGMVNNINKRLQLLKCHAPYHETDYVLKLAANAFGNGTRLEHLELLRNDAAYLDAIGAASIPDPTTAGGFCRRFKQTDIDGLLWGINEIRLNVWEQQDESFLEQAIIDVDGVIVATKGENKESMYITFNGSWGNHPLLISLATTKEVLAIVNRSGSVDSASDVAMYLDTAIRTCIAGGFKRVRLRGDCKLT